ncbi:hypothetical protein ABEY41_24740 [Peribacillus butanolivorans]|uniref:hypothetical protein n=1 Tax=Peribacillus butanolivorans TaxID=421767 RepID=UPI003D28EAD5
MRKFGVLLRYKNGDSFAVQKSFSLALYFSALHNITGIFRHAIAIISHLNGVDVYQIMKSLGHEQLSTTEIYLEKIFEKERHAIHLWKSDVLGVYI